MELSKNPTTFNMKVMSDPESGFYAEDILRTLKSAGWQVESKTLPIGELWEGLVLSFHTDDPAMPQLAEAFKKANIPFTYGNEKSPKVTIIVGGKPPAF